MDSMPNAILELILSQMNNARHVASCSCVSKGWKECIQFVPSLYFPRNIFEGVSLSQANATITRMVSSATTLEELIVYCPFLESSLAFWLSLRNPTLRILELRLDMASKEETDGNTLSCIELAKGLEVLKLWAVSLTKSPDWSTFMRLQCLEIFEAEMSDDSLYNALQACPNLTCLALLRCRGVNSVVIAMEMLEICRLEFFGEGNHSLSVTSPRIRVLEIQGFSWIHIDRNHHLERLCIAETSVFKVEVGKLMELEYLSLSGLQWNWSAIDSLLRCANEVKHLVMKIEFSGDHDALEPFPEIDLIDFFNGHPRLKSFEIHGAMFAALSQRNSLKNLDWKFGIPCLEEVFITVRSPLNAAQKLNTLALLVKYSTKLSKMVVRISQMRGSPEDADDFYRHIAGFQFLNNKIVEMK